MMYLWAMESLVWQGERQQPLMDHSLLKVEKYILKKPPSTISSFLQLQLTIVAIHLTQKVHFYTAIYCDQGFLSPAVCHARPRICSDLKLEIPAWVNVWAISQFQDIHTCGRAVARSLSGIWKPSVKEIGTKHHWKRGAQIEYKLL